MANVVSSSALPYQLNGTMLGGLTVNDNGSFYSLRGGTSGSYDTTLSSSINNQSIIGALNSVYDAASGNEPGGVSGSIQTNDNNGGFAGSSKFKYDIGHHAILEGAQELQFRDNAIKISSSADTYLDITADGKINLSGAVGANSTFTAEGAVSGAAGSFDAITGVSLALQGGGITAAGAIAGATTIAASSNATIEGIVSGAAGTFDALGGTSLALQGGGITAAGAIAGATTINASGLATVGGVTDGTATIAAGAGTGFVGLSTSATGFVSGTFIHAEDLLQTAADSRTELTGALHVSGGATFSQTAIVAEAGINAKGSSTFFGGDTIFGSPGVAGSTLTVMGTTAAGSPMAYRIAVTGGILNVLEAQ